MVGRLSLFLMICRISTPFVLSLWMFVRTRLNILFLSQTAFKVSIVFPTCKTDKNRKTTEFKVKQLYTSRYIYIYVNRKIYLDKFGCEAYQKQYYDK